jgi:hypothetical protein
MDIPGGWTARPDGHVAMVGADLEVSNTKRWWLYRPVLTSISRSSAYRIVMFDCKIVTSLGKSASVYVYAVPAGSIEKKLPLEALSYVVC